MIEARGATRRGEPLSSKGASWSGGVRLPVTQDEITGSLMWSIVIGEKPSLLEGIPDAMGTKGRYAGCGSKVPAGEDVAVRCQRTEPGGGEGKAGQRPRSMNTEDRDRVTIFRMPTVPTERLTRECNTREQGHQGNYFTDSPELATVY